MHKERVRSVSELDLNPTGWLLRQFSSESELDAVHRLHSVFSKAMFSVIALSMKNLGVELGLHDGELAVGKSSLSDVVELSVREGSFDQYAEFSKRYDYLILTIKDIFCTLIFAHYLSNREDAELFQLATHLVEEAEVFLTESEQEPSQLEKCWKKMNGYAAGWVKTYFAEQFKWDALQKLFKKVFPYIQPYLSYIPDYHSGPVSILTVSAEDSRAEALLNIPMAANLPRHPQWEGFESRLFQHVPELAQLMAGLSGDIQPFTNLPINSQAGNYCANPENGSSFPRNTRLQVAGRMSANRLEVSHAYYQMASPSLPPRLLTAILRLFFRYKPRDFPQIQAFCRAYVETARAMCGRAFSLFFDTPENGWKFVYTNIITGIFPPEPDIIDSMKRISLPRWHYINAPYKDFEIKGVSRVEFKLAIPVSERVRDFIDCNQFLWVINQIATTVPMGNCYVKNYCDTVLGIEHFKKRRTPRNYKLYDKKLVDSFVFFLSRASVCDEANPLPCLLSWFFILSLMHRYSPVRRIDRSDVWRALLDDALLWLSETRRIDFKMRFAVFYYLVPQIASISAIMTLLVDISSLFQGVEGCKSAKDRETELALLKVFVYHIIFLKSNAVIARHLRLHSVHHTAFLKFFGQLSGAMDNGGFADLKNKQLDRCPGTRERLSLFNDALRGIRSKPAQYRNQVFGGMKPKPR